MIVATEDNPLTVPDATVVQMVSESFAICMFTPDAVILSLAIYLTTNVGGSVPSESATAIHSAKVLLSVSPTNFIF